MSYIKNKANQKVSVIASTSGGVPITGDAANITAKISLDFGAAASVAGTNPTELDATNFPGVYVFDLTQAETNADVITIKADSTTASANFDVLTITTITLTETSGQGSSNAVLSAEIVTQYYQGTLVQ